MFSYHKINILKEYSNTIDIGCDRLFAKFRGVLVHFVVWSSSFGNAPHTCAVYFDGS